MLPFLTHFAQIYAQNTKNDFQKVSIEIAGEQAHWITDISHDQMGFIWMTNRDGLIKYDGYESKVYKHNAHDSSSVQSNYLEPLYVDSAGDVWVRGHKWNK